MGLATSSVGTVVCPQFDNSLGILTAARYYGGDWWATGSYTLQNTTGSPLTLTLDHAFSIAIGSDTFPLSATSYQWQFPVFVRSTTVLAAGQSQSFGFADIESAPSATMTLPSSTLPVLQGSGTFVVPVNMGAVPAGLTTRIPGLMLTAFSAIVRGSNLGFSSDGLMDYTYTEIPEPGTLLLTLSILLAGLSPARPGRH